MRALQAYAKVQRPNSVHAVPELTSEGDYFCLVTKPRAPRALHRTRFGKVRLEGIDTALMLHLITYVTIKQLDGAANCLELL